MTGFKFRLLTALLCSSSLLSAQFTDVINSNRPGKSMAAFSVGKTVIQAETGGYYLNENYPDNSATNGWGIDFAVRYGAFLEQLEFIIDGQYQNDTFENALLEEKRNGFRQFIVGAKYLLFDPNRDYEEKPNLYSWKANHRFKWRDLLPSIGIYGGLNFNLNNPFVPDTEPGITPKAMLITQNQFKRSVLVVNVVADRLASKSMTIGYIATLTYGINSRVSSFVENQNYYGDFFDVNILRAGGAYLLKENMQVDLSAGLSLINDPSQLVLSTGLSWRFDDNYEDLFLRVSKDNPKEKDKTTKKDKSKKKRKDNFNLENGDATK